MDIIDNLRKSIDDRRDLVKGEDKFHTIQLCVFHFIKTANQAISERDAFHVALSGGSTPKAIFQSLSEETNRNQIDWSKVYLWWSDERSVDGDDENSNYRMAMDAGFSDLPVPEDHIFRMKGEGDIEAHALEYEELIKEHVPDQKFDLVMLGMGEDGHTASLFPETHALHSDGRLVVANFIPKLDTWRLTFTYKLINDARQIVVYVIGENKAEMLDKIVNSDYSPDHLPLQRVGTAANKALVITDNGAGKILEK